MKPARNILPRTRTAGWLLSMFFIFCSCLSAQIYFGVSPIRVEHRMKAGGRLTDVFYVRNNSDRPIRIKVYTENWYLGEEGPPFFIGNRETAFSCQAWIKVNPFDFRLQPGEIKQVRYTISVPEEAAAGGYHAAVSFENVPEGQVTGRLGQVAITGKIAAAVYVTVGNVQPEGQIEEFQFVNSEQEQFFKIKIRNLGAVHFRLKGEITLRDKNGKKVAMLNLPDEPVLPESWRWVRVPVKEKLASGLYKAELRLDIGRDELLGFDREFEIK